jgi:hypothetical protein
LGPREKEGGEVKTLKGDLKRSFGEEREFWNKRQIENGSRSAAPEIEIKQSSW